MNPSTFLSAPGLYLLDLLAAGHDRAGALRALPAWVPGLVVAAGVFALLAGARWRLPVSAAGAGAAGALAGVALSAWLGAPPLASSALGAALLAGGALLLPALFPFALGALPGAFLGARLDLVGHPAASAALGAALLGGLAILAARPLAAAFAGLSGAALVGAGLVGLDRAWPPLAEVTGRPVALAAVLLVLAVAGAAAQVGSAWGAGPRKKRGGNARRDEAGGAEPQHA